jgi:hypothetical protein
MIRLALLIAFVALCDASPKPTFPLGWSSHESMTFREGPATTRNAGVSYFDGKNKKEAFIKDKGAHGAWDVVVTDYSNPKHPQGQEFHMRLYKMSLKNKTIVRHCTEWCVPDTPEVCDMFDSLCQVSFKRDFPKLLCNFDRIILPQPEYISKGKFVRTTNITVDGEDTPADEFSWPDGIGPIPINALTLYTEPSAGGCRICF